MNRIKEIRKRNNLSQSEFAKLFNVHQTAVSQWETGRTVPDFEIFKQMAKVFNVSLDYLIGESESQINIALSQNTNSTKIPVLGEVAAGLPIFADDNIIDYEEIPTEMAKNGEYFALKIHGDSMEPRIYNNDIVIVRKQDDVDNGDIAIVIVNGDLGTCKKVIKHSSGISLVSLNSKYEPMFYTADEILKLPLTIIGKVIELRGKL